jgi:hypothetical protein
MKRPLSSKVYAELLPFQRQTVQCTVDRKTTRRFAKLHIGTSSVGRRVYYHPVFESVSNRKDKICSWRRLASRWRHQTLRFQFIKICLTWLRSTAHLQPDEAKGRIASCLVAAHRMVVCTRLTYFNFRWVCPYIVANIIPAHYHCWQSPAGCVASCWMCCFSKFSHHSLALEITAVGWQLYSSNHYCWRRLQLSSPSEDWIASYLVRRRTVWYHGLVNRSADTFCQIRDRKLYATAFPMITRCNCSAWDRLCAGFIAGGEGGGVGQAHPRPILAPVSWICCCTMGHCDSASEVKAGNGCRCHDGCGRRGELKATASQQARSWSHTSSSAAAS